MQTVRQTESASILAYSLNPGPRTQSSSRDFRSHTRASPDLDSGSSHVFPSEFPDTHALLSSATPAALIKEQFAAEDCSDMTGSCVFLPSPDSSPYAVSAPSLEDSSSFSVALDSGTHSDPQACINPFFTGDTHVCFLCESKLKPELMHLLDRVLDRLPGHTKSLLHLNRRLYFPGSDVVTDVLLSVSQKDLTTNTRFLLFGDHEYDFLSLITSSLSLSFSPCHLASNTECRTRRETSCSWESSSKQSTS